MLERIDLLFSLLLCWKVWSEFFGPRVFHVKSFVLFFVYISFTDMSIYTNIIICTSNCHSYEISSSTKIFKILKINVFNAHQHGYHNIMEVVVVVTSI